ncbi:Glycosyltransferase involved in cell wall bisynthesis [Quadrisphaera granulorum]|uniref:Glycosyltransferase involved in cell wall biosynthesis n=1 Tax=Quadrisphaera granulorum TaxID=317664 RepID=A0A316ABJ2_9ACTN|nr:glycosyltransferase [Quadrisphaera granulorum]PWJ55146.1 glycosyltransferase involved in cell wall biosynthesis [Quadrisphaera granulorum]SZE95655.1 Glycosyltransferase involved in cell wall bisynthesis [Quadrisphaera granulorum]
MSGPRVTIVHERFTEHGGSEAVVEALARHWAEAPVLAPVARDGVVADDVAPRVRSTALSRLLRGSGYAHLLPLLPIAMRRLHLPESDVVIASHHAFATQVALTSQAPVVAYVHTPARWVWDPALRATEGSGLGSRLGTAGLAAFSAAFRRHDVDAAQRVHTLVANSTCVADRIRTWWGREAQVVAPPVNTNYFNPDPKVPREDFFLLAGRLVPYKRPDLAVRAAARAGVRLVVAGEGRARRDVEALAGPRTTFLGRIGDDELRGLFRRCRALLMPGVEDFGIVPVEAMACGAPVIAAGEGGALDTVVPGLSGVLVDQVGNAGEVEAWAQALAGFDAADLDTHRVRQHAEGFSRVSFARRMSDVVESVTRGAGVPRQDPHGLHALDELLARGAADLRAGDLRAGHESVRLPETVSRGAHAR